MKLLKRCISNKFIISLLSFLIFLLIWSFIAEIIDEKTLIFPGPLTTIQYTFTLLGNAYTYKCIFASLSRICIAFLISLFSAFILGTLSGIFPIIEKLLKTTILSIKAIPTAALLFLFLVMAGAQNAPIYVVTLLTFPVLYDSVIGGIRNIPTMVKDAVKLDGGNNLKTIFKIRIPLGFPYLVVGMTSAFGLAFKVEIMAEVLAGSTRNGIGSAILAAQKNDVSNMTPIFAWSLLAIVIMIMISVITNIIKQKYI